MGYTNDDKETLDANVPEVSHVHIANNTVEIEQDTFSGNAIEGANDNYVDEYKKKESEAEAAVNDDLF